MTSSSRALLTDLLRHLRPGATVLSIVERPRGGETIRRDVARDQMMRQELLQRGGFQRTSLHPGGAPRMEPAARRDAHRARRLALDRRGLSPRAPDLRNGR